MASVFHLTRWLKMNVSTKNSNSQMCTYHCVKTAISPLTDNQPWFIGTDFEVLTSLLTQGFSSAAVFLRQGLAGLTQTYPFATTSSGKGFVHGNSRVNQKNWSFLSVTIFCALAHPQDIYWVSMNIFCTILWQNGLFMEWHRFWIWKSYLLSSIMCNDHIGD